MCIDSKGNATKATFMCPSGFTCENQLAVEQSPGTTSKGIGSYCTSNPNTSICQKYKSVCNKSNTPKTEYLCSQIASVNSSGQLVY